MYCYLYDDYIQGDKRHEKELLQIENRLTDLGISGKISRLALFRDAEEMIRDEIDKGVDTVVVLGNDDTVRKVLNVVVESEVVFAIIPIGANNELARLLGIPSGVEACDVLSARRIEKIDIGTVNEKKFISGVGVPEFKAELTFQSDYRIIPIAKSGLKIENLAEVSDPCDGILNVEIVSSVKKGVFKKGKTVKSVFPTKSLAIRSDKPFKLYADGEEMKGVRFDIGVDSKSLKVITGKDRVFCK
jgi:diacylglycerol kinase family enzyme